MNTIKNSTVKLNGIEYDFTGVEATLTGGFSIVKVVCLNTGKDLTKEYKDKYRKPRMKVNKDVFDMLVKVNGFDFASELYEVKNEN